MNLLFEGKTEGFGLLLFGEFIMAAIYTIAALSILKYAERACRKAGKFDLF